MFQRVRTSLLLVSVVVGNSMAHLHASVAHATRVGVRTHFHVGVAHHHRHGTESGHAHHSHAGDGHHHHASHHSSANHEGGEEQAGKDCHSAPSKPLEHDSTAVYLAALDWLPTTPLESLIEQGSSSCRIEEFAGTLYVSRCVAAEFLHIPSPPKLPLFLLHASLRL